MINDFQEYYFLTDCYGVGISDKKVYRLFVIKVLSNLPCPSSHTISQLHNHILKDYGIEIPHTYILEIIKEIPGFKTDFILNKDILHMKKLPESLNDQVNSQQQIVDNDTRLLFEEFNKHLRYNNLEKTTYAEFKETFMIYCNLITNIEITHTKLSRIMSDWIIGVYKNNTNLELILALNKMVYSWLLYTYFYSVKRQKKLLNNFQIVFDTNILAYLLEINGTERKIYVEFLLKKIRVNNCKVLVHSYTIKELINLINSGKTVSIVIFRNNFVDTCNQLRYNADEFLKVYFRKYDISLEIINDQPSIDTNSNEYRNISSDLYSYKQYKRPSVTEESIYHDIMLIYAFGALKKVTNIYMDKKLIATCDNILFFWLGKYLKRVFDSDYSHLLTLDKINLIFWIESDKAESSSFLGNTWMYITETLGFFNNKNVDEYFMAMKKKFNESSDTTDNWRSLYLLINNTINDGRNIEDFTEDEIEKALDSIDKTVIKENEDLRTTNEILKAEMKKIKTEVMELKKDIDRSNDKVVVNVNVPPQRQVEDMTIFELLKVLIKKILRFFCN